MSTTSKLTTTIGLWLDTTSDSPHDGGTWIVSRDKIDAKGNAEQSRTLATFGPDDYTEAREEAMRLGDAENLRVIEMDECGRRETIREVAETVYVVRDAGGEYVRDEEGTKRTPASNEAYEFAAVEDAKAACTRATDKVLSRDAE